MNEYKVTIKVQNNYLFTAMREKGIETAAQLSRETEVSQQEIGGYLNLKRAPFFKNGDYCPGIVKISEYLNTMIEQLFPEDHLYTPLKTNKAVIELSKTELLSLTGGDEPQLLLETSEQAEAIRSVLASLPERKAIIIKQRFGIDCEAMTLEEVATNHDVTKERIRQIEATALRMLRHPRRTDVLRMERKDIQTAEEWQTDHQSKFNA